MKQKSKRAPSRIVKCDICQMDVRERGLKNHIRLAHKLNLTERMISNGITQVKAETTQVKSKEVTQVKFIETIEVERSYSEFGGYDRKKYQDQLVREICQKLGIVPHVKTGDDIRKETEAWLNTNSGKDMLSNIRKQEELRLQRDREKNLKK